LVVSLLIDCGNALVMTVAGTRKGHVDFRRGLILSAFAVIWVLLGIHLGRGFIPDNTDLFKGSAGIVTILLGFGFLQRGAKIRNLKKQGAPPAASPVKRSISTVKSGAFLIYVGVAVMAFPVGLVGIGGGMGFAIFLMLCLSYPTLKATATAMLITFFSTLVAAVLIAARIPPEIFPGPNLPLLPLVLIVSMTATGIGAVVTHRLPQEKVNFLIGGLVVLAGIIATVQKYLFV